MTQNKSKIIGLTGGIASGKSSVSKILIEKGYKVIDADLLARKVVEVGQPGYNKIVKEFGQDILLANKEINRKALGQIIFKNKERREILNKITHPLIFKLMKKHVRILSENNNIIFLDVPLLLEQYDLWQEHGINFDEIVLVYLRQEDQLIRLQKRNKISKEEAMLKINSQLSLDKKLKMASKIIDNSGDLEDLNKQIDKLLLELI